MEDEYEMQQDMARKNNRPSAKQTFWTQQVINQSMNDAAYMRSNSVASLVQGR